jgi:hypothetical protein
VSEPKILHCRRKCACSVYSHAEEDLKKASQTGWNAVHDWHPIWEQAVLSSAHGPYMALHSDSNVANFRDHNEQGSMGTIYQNRGPICYKHEGRGLISLWLYK